MRTRSTMRCFDCARLQNQRASKQKGLAFPLKKSVYADVRGVKNDRRTALAPSIASIRGSSW
jgi:hypothetical protein